MAVGVIGMWILWEFYAAFSRSIAFSEYVEKSMDRKALKILDVVSEKVAGEKLSE